MMKIHCNHFVDLDAKLIKNISLLEFFLSLTCKIHIYGTMNPFEGNGCCSSSCCCGFLGNAVKSDCNVGRATKLVKRLERKP